jgi:RNA polymerase sigma-70 factor (ECF subfamily)
MIRTDLSAEAIRLGRLLVELLPDAEALGLLALMLLQDSRRDARLSPDGDIVLLADQDRSRWDRGEIEEGAALAARAMRAQEIGAYALQAAIAPSRPRRPRRPAAATRPHERSACRLPARCRAGEAGGGAEVLCAAAE